MIRPPVKSPRYQKRKPAMPVITEIEDLRLPDALDMAGSGFAPGFRVKRVKSRASLTGNAQVIDFAR